MSNATVQYIGATNLTTGVPADLDAERSLYLKLFSGEVITQFEKSTVMLDKHKIRTISSGRSAQFPVVGNLPDAEYHTAGQEILGQQAPHNEVTLTVDRLLISHVFLSNIDEAMSHFEVRSDYSRQMGERLAQRFDRNMMLELFLAAAASATVTGGNGGLAITDDDLKSATMATKLDAFVNAIETANVNFDNKFVTGERYCLLTPADYYFLTRARDAGGWSPVHRDYGGGGSIAEGTIPKIEGVNLIKAPTLPVGDYSADPFHPANTSLLKSLIFTEDAVGTVKLLDLALESEWDMRRQGTLMLAKYAMGHGILRPESAVSVSTLT